MTYGDHSDPPLGRAQVPGTGPSGGYGSGFGGSGYESDGGYDRGYSGSGDDNGQPVPQQPGRGSASVGSASVGSASVPEPTSGGITGRASVPPPGGAGRAAVTGRASVRASAPVGGPGGFGYDSGDVIDGPGGPPPGRAGLPRGGRPAAKKGSRYRRRNIIIASVAAVVMLFGIALVGGTYYVDSVEVPADAVMHESTTIFYADGKTPMAKIGEENRTLVTIKQIPDHVEQAVVATEDMTFYENSGIDYRGIARAAWNNFTGGERQGASTITQQYARQVAELKDVTYMRKLREAVIARKLNGEYEKWQILERYLNAVYFGRHAYGIEAASQAYFGKSVDKITVAEGMVLAGLIKDPEGENGKGSPYDPTRNPDTAKARFNNYIKPNMVQLGYLKQEDADKLVYPENVIKIDPKVGDGQLRAQWGLDKPEGLVVHQVMSELRKVKSANGQQRFSAEEIRYGGLQIITTIDKAKQDAAVLYASGAANVSPLFGQPANFQAALVAVEPYTGRVRAYYGGPEGDGSDYAHWYQDDVLADGQPTGYGAHPPASSFKIYTLAAALVAGYTIDSKWDGNSPKDFPRSQRTAKLPAGPIKNNDGGNAKCGTWCTLETAVAQSLNTPFFAITEAVTWQKVLEVAHAAGIRNIWHPTDGRLDLNVVKPANARLSTELGIGQYPVTVLDHANGVATFAARGKRAEAHFVQQIVKDGRPIYAETINPKQILQGKFTEAMADNMTWALSHVTAGQPNGAGDILDRNTAAKTGTWQLSAGAASKVTGNAHTWMVGYVPPGADRNKTPGLATAVWVGNKKEEQALKPKSGGDAFGSTVAAPTYRRFMGTVLKNTEKVKLPAEPKPIGDKDIGNGVNPAPTVPPDPGTGNGNGTPSPNPSASSSPAPSKPAGGGGGGAGLPFPIPSRTKIRD